MGEVRHAAINPLRKPPSPFALFWSKRLSPTVARRCASNAAAVPSPSHAFPNETGTFPARHCRNCWRLPHTCAHVPIAVNSSALRSATHVAFPMMSERRGTRLAVRPKSLRVRTTRLALKSVRGRSLGMRNGSKRSAHGQFRLPFRLPFRAKAGVQLPHQNC